MMTPQNSQAEAHPLTSAQQSLYFLQQLTNGEPVYNMPQAFRLRGELNVTALEKALRVLIGRHDGLRMTIAQTVNGPQQGARPREELSFRIHDVDPAQANEAVQKAVRESFD